MIIKDKKGISYSLTAKLLKELRTGNRSYFSRFVVLKNFTPAKKVVEDSYRSYGMTYVHYADNNEYSSKPERSANPLVNHGLRYVGCRPFTAKTYALIVEAAKVAKKAAKA